MTSFAQRPTMMKSFYQFVFLSLLSFHTRPNDAFWRMACSVSQTSRIDPILAPGNISGHVHKFVGGSNVNKNSNHDSLLSSTCSTCEVQADKSAYWTPQLYYQHGDGRIEEVPNQGMTIYYVGRGGSASNTSPFPAGFKMISGSSSLRHYDRSNLTYQNTRPIADRVSFRCINEANNIPETHYLDRTDCVNGLRAQVNFQSCWDGVNLFKSDQSHVAYLSGIDYGVCPPTHPVPIPGLFFEVLYFTNRVAQGDGGRFVFANGDTTGYGFHGDFINGWQQDVQNRAVQDCLYVDNGGVVSACSPLAPSDDINFARTCLESPQVVDEVYKGILPNKALPGCNPVTSGPEDIAQVVCGLNSSVPIVAISSTSISVATTSPGATLTSTSNSVQSTSTLSTETISNRTTIISNTPITSSVSTLANNPGVFAQGASNTTSSTVTNATAAVSTSLSTKAEKSKVVTITVSGYTTLALLLPATLTPDTTFSDVAQASSYIDSLVSIAADEAASPVTTSTTNPIVAPTTATESRPSTTSYHDSVVISTITMTVTNVVTSMNTDASSTQMPAVSTNSTTSMNTATFSGGAFYGNTTSASNRTTGISTRHCAAQHANITNASNSNCTQLRTLTTFTTEYAPVTIVTTFTTNTTLTATTTSTISALSLRGRRIRSLKWWR